MGVCLCMADALSYQKHLDYDNSGALLPSPYQWHAYAVYICPRRSSSQSHPADYMRRSLYKRDNALGCGLNEAHTSQTASPCLERKRSCMLLVMLVLMAVDALPLTEDILQAAHLWKVVDDRSMYLWTSQMCNHIVQQQHQWRCIVIIILIILSKKWEMKSRIKTSTVIDLVLVITTKYWIISFEKKKSFS